jgi:hypothetical protein
VRQEDLSTDIVTSTSATTSSQPLSPFAFTENFKMGGPNLEVFKVCLQLLSLLYSIPYD